MDRHPTNIAASVKQRLLDLARRDGRVFDIVLVRYALERLLYRLSKSAYRDRFILKGGMLVTLWVEGSNRETRDADFLGFGDDDADNLRRSLAEIMAMKAEDGLRFDTDALTATTIRDDMEYGGIRLRTSAYLERTRIPVTLDIGFGDALPDTSQQIEYPSLLGMETSNIRAYPPATVIAEKFQAIVALGIANGRMKDYYDLWAIPKALAIPHDELDRAIKATFERRQTAIPAHRPPGLSDLMVNDPLALQRWRAYAGSLDIPGLALKEVCDAIWATVAPTCSRLC